MNQDEETKRIEKAFAEARRMFEAPSIRDPALGALRDAVLASIETIEHLGERASIKAFNRDIDRPDQNFEEYLFSRRDEIRLISSQAKRCLEGWLLLCEAMPEHQRSRFSTPKNREEVKRFIGSWIERTTANAFSKIAILWVKA